MADKKSRKELLKQDDAFLAAAGQSFNWMRHHRLAVIVPVAIVLVAIVGVWVGIELTEHRRLAGSTLYAQALELKNAEIASDTTKADPAHEPPIYASKQDRAKAARAAFQKVIDAAPSSGVAELARFYAADLDVELGERDQALAAFRALADSITPDDNLYFLAVERSAYLLEQKDDVAGATQMWERLTGSSKRFYADHALFELARLHADKGENDKARALLARIEKDYPQSSLMPKVQELYAKVGRPETAAVSPAENGATAKAKP